MKKAPSERKDIDLNDIIADTVKFLSPEARSRATALRSKLNGAPLQISGDPIQLQQVFSNLILNGLDATSDATQAEKAVTVTPNTKVVALAPGDRNDLKPNEKVFIPGATAAGNGSVEANRLTVGKDGVAPPM